MKILFTESTIPFILEAIGKEIDRDGYVVDTETKEYEYDIDGKSFKAKKLIGIVGKKYITNICQLQAIVIQPKLK